jgi:hypothetical protein
MNLLTYIIILLVSFLGLLVGVILSSITSEEIRHASKYLRYINLVLAPIILLTATYKLSKIYSLLLAIILFIVLIVLRDKYDDKWIYSGMGLMLCIAVISQELFNAAILIFIYSMSISTINSSKYMKNNQKMLSPSNIKIMKNIFCKYSWYLVTGILFFVIFSYIL